MQSLVKSLIFAILLFMLSSASIVSVALSGLSLALLTYSVYLSVRLSKFMKGQDGKTLESAIASDRKLTKELSEENKVLKSRLDTVENKLSQSIRAVDTVRFNPFADQGSNQSFSSAFIDEKGNGVVLSSLYSRERVSVFAKPISDFQSTYELTSEEKESINNVKKKQYAK
jgi:hypothetical protein